MGSPNIERGSLFGSYVIVPTLSFKLPQPPAVRRTAKLTRPTDAHATRRIAIGAAAIGALATGALAVGAMAIGRLAIGRLTLKEGRIKKFSIDELEVGTLRVRELITESRV